MANHPRFGSGTRPFSGSISLLLATGATAPLLAQPCEPQWSERFHAGVVTQALSSNRILTVDGPSGALVLIASHASVAGFEPTAVVAYDGSTFFPLAGGLPGQVRTMIRGRPGLEDLYLIAGTNFAAWNRASPNQWQLHPIGTTDVRALIIHDDGSGPSVFATGNFWDIGGVSAHGIARWNGQQWNALGNGLGNASATLGGRGMAVFDDGAGPALFVGGHFHTSQGGPGDGLAKWDGAVWHHIQTPAAVNLLTTFDDGSGPRLYAVGISSAFPFSQWENPGWTTLSPAVLSQQSTFKQIQTPMGPRLVIYGTRLWDGQSHPPFPGGDLRLGGFPTYSSPGIVIDADVADFGSGPELIVLGNFMAAGEEGIGGFNLARNSGTQWLPIGLGISHGWPGFNTPSTITSLAVHDEGHGPQLYAGGSFAFAGGQAAASLARFDGERWISLNPEAEPIQVEALQSWDDGSGPALYLSLQFHPTSRLRRYRAGEFFDIPAPWDILTLRALDLGAGPRLVAGSASHVGIYDGSSWEQRPRPAALRDVRAVAVYDDGSGHGPVLYIGGTGALNTTTTPVLRWINSDWQFLPGPQSVGSAIAMHVHRDGSGESLYIGGSFIMDGITGPYGIARWDGAWRPYPSRVVHSLATFDDGRGPAIYAGASTTGTSPHPRGVLRLNSDQWELVVGPFSSNNSTTTGRNAILALQPFIDEHGTRSLFAGGDFTHAAGTPSFRIAQYVGCPTVPPICYANCDGNNAPPILTIDDFTCFINTFAIASELPHNQQLTHYANCDGSTTAPVLNIDDFSCFINQYAAGCP
jgi:trimeric autotransporter adhesin